MKNQSGFTLIELLIVIALLGALAVGLLASLDPFEQFKKGADTSTRNTVAEIQAAIIRYYSVQNKLPWGTTSTTSPAIVSIAGNAAPTSTAITEMEGSGELKSDFSTLAAAALPNIFLNATENSLDFKVCYKPTSKSFIGDSNTKYLKTGGLDAAIPATSALKVTYCAAADKCYWCL